MKIINAILFLSLQLTNAYDDDISIRMLGKNNKKNREGEENLFTHRSRSKAVKNKEIKLLKQTIRELEAKELELIKKVDYLESNIQNVILSPEPTTIHIQSMSYEEDPFYERMFISSAESSSTWKQTQTGFRYIEFDPILTSKNNCPGIKAGGGEMKSFEVLHNPNEYEEFNKSFCSLYNFKLVIFNNLTETSTVHFHGLAPPSNQDGVPFVANAAIHPENLQRYQFRQYTYPGMFWMHSHVGFQQAYGVAVPLIFQHPKDELDDLPFDKEDDLIIMLEDGFIYPKCAYSTYWYPECNANKMNWKGEVPYKVSLISLLINRQEAPIEHKPITDSKYVRIRLLNGGSEAPWSIQSESSMEVIALDSSSVRRPGLKTNSFILGLANRADILVEYNPRKDIVVVATQMKHSGPVTNPALRYAVIRGKETRTEDKVDLNKLLPTGGSSVVVEPFSHYRLLAKAEAAHPFPEKKPDRFYTIVTKGGEQFGGYPMTIYEGLPKEGSNIMSMDLHNLYPVYNYTDFNQLKFVLPPYKIYKNRRNGAEINTRRSCQDCEVNQSVGIRNRPKGSTYDIFATEQTANDTCCWEWCDWKDVCSDFDLVDVSEYRPNKNYIPVCRGDRVQILFINAASWLEGEGHPMHLHGHNFIVRDLYNVTNGILLKEENTFGPNGAMLDTVWMPYDKGVLFEFNADNPGEHLFHCHNDFHLENGMMTTVRYLHNEECSDLPPTVGGTSAYPKQICTMDNCKPPSDNELPFE